ncbi:MAG: RNA polymerase sigma-70 factor [Actinomycetota bacterium]
MTHTTSDVAAFAEARPQLFAVAYRMLGTVSDAEDVLQESYLRWQQADRSLVETPAAYLTTVVTRLCLDVLKSARVQRETYVGPWLPEPLLTETAPDPAETAELADSLSMAFLVLLESLSPLERAAFLLREVFGYSYADLAAVLERDEAACRQLVSRARGHVETRRPRFAVTRADGERLTTEFLVACGTGDVAGLMALLASDVVLHSDGGGRVSAARRPVYGADDVARFLIGITKNPPSDMAVRLTRVNGDPGFLVTAGGNAVFVLGLEIAGDKVTGVNIVRNPEKLTRI